LTSEVAMEAASPGGGYMLRHPTVPEDLLAIRKCCPAAPLLNV
jgi:hypothetical protein